MKIQWGIKPANTYDVSFHLAFSSSDSYSFNYIANKNRCTADGWHYYHTPSATGIKVMSKDEQAMWFAIGY